MLHNEPQRQEQPKSLKDLESLAVSAAHLSSQHCSYDPAGQHKPNVTPSLLKLTQ